MGETLFLSVTSNVLPLNDATSRTILSTDSGSKDSLQPIPGPMLWPFAHALCDDEALQHVVRQSRRDRGASMETDESWIDLLGASDATALHDASPLTVRADHGLQEFRRLLYSWLAFNPDMSELGEVALHQLRCVVDEAGNDAHFMLNLPIIFSVGQDFERINVERIIPAFEPQGADDEDRNGPARIVLDQLRNCLLGLVGVKDRLQESNALQHVPTDAKHLHALRMAILHGDWETFCTQVEPQDPDQSQLILFAHSRVVERIKAHTPNPDEAKTVLEAIRLRRNQLLLRSGNEEYVRMALNDQIALAFDLREQERFDESVAIMRATLADYQPAFATGEFNTEHLRLLSNLTFAYIKLVNQPQAAFELLAPAVKSLEAGSHADTTEQLRGMIRANLRSSVIHMEAEGIDVPADYRSSALSSADEAELSKWDSEFGKAMADKRSQDALAIADQSLALLESRGIADTRHYHLAWSIDRARALRAMGHPQRALEELESIIDRAESVSDMHARQNVPRAMIALALAQSELGLASEECNSYRKLLRGPYAQLPNPIIARNIRIAHQNLGSELEKQGDNLGAYENYRAGHEVALRLGQQSAGADLLWWAYKAAAKLNDLGKQQETLQKLCDIYATSADAQAQKRWKESKGALDVINARVNPPKSALGRWVQSFLNKTNQ